MVAVIWRSLQRPHGGGGYAGDLERGRYRYGRRESDRASSQGSCNSKNHVTLHVYFLCDPGHITATV